MNVNSYQPYTRTGQAGKTIAFKANENEQNMTDKNENVFNVTTCMASLALGQRNSGDQALAFRYALPGIVKQIEYCGDMPCKTLAKNLNENFQKYYPLYQPN